MVKQSGMDTNVGITSLMVHEPDYFIAYIYLSDGLSRGRHF